MHVFLLGGTGFIGRHILQCLVEGGHEVVGLARSEASAERLRTAGAAPLLGDLRAPGEWAARVPPVDAVIHAAADFGDDMGEVETAMLDALLPVLGAMPKRPRFVYTGGCWLFGATGEQVATEGSTFDPLPAFDWMIDNMRRVLEAPEVEGAVIHPAMVYSGEGGVFSSFIDALRAGHAVDVIGSPEIVWPLVHADDLADLYLRTMEWARPGSVYNGSAISGIAVGAIVSGVADHLGVERPELRVVSVDEAAERLGAWARGYAISQRLSGDKARAELGWQPRHASAAALF
ncbi:nucleoside-diphosphate-sugar epimerase [Aminobacter aminovorans]|uniref:NADH-flavin reductase n=1 Tax=Aminobacter aminovorans TaxID=83263 RepID=A0A380WJT9_AMIAI|nr:NAD-dependent epimerase/dehydratase family protein [Aminobacter aminovorans]TCS24301.1 nucleoside-diphosphate-sugar epimerase [Aminobacter aminovorans]SUU89191.1 Putative NADH-flavin reductase [Aminobacter aminovorans]